MRLWCNQEEILKLHGLGRRAWPQLDASTFSEEERDGISQLCTLRKPVSFYLQGEM